MAVEEYDPLTGHKMTGHEWNGIKELNTRVPIAVWLFLIVTVIFSIGYWILMPAWPMGKDYTKGLLNYDHREVVLQKVSKAVEARGHWIQQIETLNYDQIEANAQLMDYIREDGHRLFGDNCSACHGTQATGNPGYPNLLDTSWLWGGSPDEVAHTIAVGINSDAHDETRVSEMMAFGRDGILDHQSVVAVANYVKTLSDPDWAKGKQDLVAKGQEVFVEQCVVCHGDDGRGSQEVGAPDLAAGQWIYGGDIDTIYETIYGGRKGEMPAWEHRLKPVDRKVLTLFLLDKGRKHRGGAS